jgi:hypothetical protein
MVDHDIQKSQHLLKRLEEEMQFLSSLLSQASIVASNIKGTWIAIDQVHKSWKQRMEE